MKLLNTFTGGINQDANPRLQPQGTYRHALNKVEKTDRFFSGGLTNQLSIHEINAIPGKIVGYHRLEERNSTLFLHISGGSAISIYNHDTNEVKLVATDKEFGCSWNFENCKWIGYGHSDSKALAPCNDLIVYWSSGRVYKKANIDELLDPVRKEGIKKLRDVCGHFLLMKCNGNARLKVRQKRGGGRDLPPGQYFAVCQLEDESGNVTNWSQIEGPVYLKGKYNKPNDLSPNSIQIEAHGLPDNYTRIKIAVIAPIGSQEQDLAYVIYDGSYNTNGVTAEYFSSSQHKENVPIAEILGKDIKFLRGENLFTHDNRLHLYRTVTEFNPKVQKWALETQVYAVTYAVPSSHAHRYKSLPPDEPIALGQVYPYCDGTTTVVGHIPGPKGGVNDISCGECNLPPGQTGNDAALYQSYATYDPVTNTYCFKAGNQSTIREDNVPDPCSSSSAITPRSDDANSCVDHKTDRNAVQDEIDAIQTTNNSLDDCIDCAKETSTADLDQSEGFFTRKVEQLTDLFRTDDEVAADCSTGKNGTIKEAAKQLYNEAIKDAEIDEELTYRTTVIKQGGKNITFSGTLITGVTKGEDCVTEEIEPIILGKYKMGGWQSSLTYSEELDCDGEPLYGEYAGLPLQFHKTPGRDLIGLTITSQAGVESRFDPSNIPGKDTYVIMIGLLVENVYIPSYEKGEIPKPLDPNTPYRIVIGKRERHNQSTIYTGYFTHTYKGLQGGKEYAVPRHAANAYPEIDRSIDNNGDHRGEAWDEPIYTFHSPDLANGADFVNGDYVTIYGFLGGDGNVYGLYEEGKKVKEDENQKDRRGMRSALNLATFVPNKFSTCIVGADFAEFNQNLQNPQGISYPLLNKYREGSLYIQLAEKLPDLIKIGQFNVENNRDHSINVGGLDHEYPTSGVVWYGSIKRFNTQQYGSLESLQYIDIGLTGRKDQTTVRGLVGDSFIQKWSHKRSSYISDKVGNYLNEDFAETIPYLGDPTNRKRGVADPLNRRGYRMREFLGFWNPQELPESGDLTAPKNFSNCHPTVGWEALQANFDALRTDIFFPRTLNHLNHLFVDTNVNLYYRSTSPRETREVFYEELQGLDVDSSINSVDPEEAWLNDWHDEHLQPSRKQSNRKAMIRFAIVVGMPALMGGGIAGLTTALNVGATMMMSPFFGVLWLLLVYNIFTNKKLIKLLGIPETKIDKEGAQDEDHTKGLKDNWNYYNAGFSAVNDNNFFIGMPSLYNTCICDELSTIIYSSNKQISTSPYDAWSNFQALSFTGIPGDTGQVQRMFKWGGGVYVQTTDALYGLPYSREQGGVLGAPIFGQPQRILDGAIEGYGGTSDPNSAITCRLGDISLDYEARDIAIYNGGFKSITHRNSGLDNFWYNNFEFCSSGCRDQNAEVHYAFGFDPEHEMLFVTKRDGENSFTYSYNLNSQHYVSEHSWTPDFYFWDRHQLYSVKDSKIHKHNVRGSYGIFGGEAHISSVDFIATNGKFCTVDYASIDSEVNIHNKADVPDVFDREETYQWLTVSTEKQTTTRMELVHENQMDKRETVNEKNYIKLSRRTNGKWNLNKLHAFELSSDDNIYHLNSCGKNETLNPTNKNYTKPDQTTKFLMGKYIKYKLEFHKNDRQIILTSVTTDVKEKD